ncbi:BnaC05g11570D [Brassica napus]|uniref:BnaC05g11570D protein n=1 Tax=Brassica napus TaxID=3708 RepID=A0A078HSA3_BRANA|nr:BnaC05g11570D [Brassica napus]
MAELEDSFLAEIDELSDYEEAGFEENAGSYGGDIAMDMSDLETLKSDDDLDSVSKLQKTQRYADIMNKVEDALGKDSYGALSEDDPLYKLIVDCNKLSVDIENEIVTVHGFIRSKYRLRFPELESFVHHAIEYASVVKQIGDAKDLTLVPLEGLSATRTTVSILLTASTTKGKPLPSDVLQKTLEACDRAIELDSALKKILAFVETKMGCIAPNLSAVVGSAKRKNLDGFSAVTTQSRVGYLEHTEIFQNTPPGLRSRAIKLLAGKSTLAARVDACRGDPSGTNGRSLREEIQKKIDKLQEPGVARQPKPLPVPDMTSKKKRGGRRLRKMKERYAVTEMRKLSNRVAFGVACEESSLGDGLGEGYGMLGQGGSKRLRVSSVPSKLKLGAKLEKKLKERQYTSGVATTGTSGFMTSRLAFTPVQGIELCNPGAVKLFSGTQSTYFSESGTFSKIKKI